MKNENVTKGKVLFKHMGSCARDAMTDYQIDWPNKIVAIRMSPLQSSDSKTFISTTLIEDCINHLISMGVTVFDDDTKDSWTPQYSNWKLLVLLGGLTLPVSVIRQWPPGSKVSRLVLEINEPTTA